MAYKYGTGRWRNFDRFKDRSLRKCVYRQNNSNPETAFLNVAVTTDVDFANEILFRPVLSRTKLLRLGTAILASRTV